MKKIIICIILSLFLFDCSVWGKPKKNLPIKTTEETIIELIINGDINGLNKEIKNNPYFMFEPIKEAYKNKSLDSKQKNAYEFVELCYEFSDLPLLQAVFLKDLDKIKANTRFNKDINKIHPQYGSALDIANILEDSAIKKEIIFILKNSGAKPSSEIKEEIAKKELLKEKESMKTVNSDLKKEKIEEKISYDKKASVNDSKIFDNLDGYKLKSKIAINSKMKLKKEQFLKHYTLNCNGYKLVIQTTYADDIVVVTKAYTFSSMKEAKKKMQQEAEKLEEKYGLQIYAEERTQKGGYIRSYNVSAFDLAASVKAEYDDFNENYECSINVFSMMLMGEAPRIAIEKNLK